MCPLHLINCCVTAALRNCVDCVNSLLVLTLSFLSLWEKIVQYMHNGGKVYYLSTVNPFSTDFLKMDLLSGTFSYSDALLTGTPRASSTCKLA